MKEITEDHISYETAKLLKEKGFNEPCTYLWIFEKTNNPEVDDNGVYKCPVKKYTESDYWNNTSIELYKKEDEYWNNNIDFFACPTLQMAMKWLRKHSWVICVIPLTFYCGEVVSEWGYNIWADDNLEINEDNTPKFKTYEEACEDAIKYCLEKLI